LARIFSLLAAIAVLLLAANFIVGLCGGDFNAAAGQKRAAQARLIDLERQMRAARIRTWPELEEAKAALAAADAAFQGPRWWMTLHMLLGSAAALMALLVNCVAVTYFIGTNRWCKEVCETYHIRPELAQRSTQLKRSAFPWALAGILAILITVGLGAAADPSGANCARSASLVMPHLLAATIGLVIVLAAFWVQIGRIAENYTVIEEILGEVRRIRAAKNLPTEEVSAP
jgi:hypothetical protein